MRKLNHKSQSNLPKFNHELAKPGLKLLWLWNRVSPLCSQPRIYIKPDVASWLVSKTSQLSKWQMLSCCLLGQRAVSPNVVKLLKPVGLAALQKSPPLSIQKNTFLVARESSVLIHSQNTTHTVPCKHCHRVPCAFSPGNENSAQKTPRRPSARGL